VWYGGVRRIGEKKKKKGWKKIFFQATLLV